MLTRKVRHTPLVHHNLGPEVHRGRSKTMSESYTKVWKPMMMVLFTCAIIYFLYHSINGDHGIIKLIQLNAEIERTKTALATIRAERTNLENHVTMMREDTIDLDMLDEQVRRVLGYVNEKETIYIIKN